MLFLDPLYGYRLQWIVQKRHKISHFLPILGCYANAMITKESVFLTYIVCSLPQ